uniref:Uncharacterized protein n=1 Tax=Lactuca sativa TaxID=4236 RepID=A0A9R1VB81_LACSA|nr:hypothetical protein LSAT_V11C500275670 [Lactuca sativa]
MFCFFIDLHLSNWYLATLLVAKKIVKHKNHKPLLILRRMRTKDHQIQVHPEARKAQIRMLREQRCGFTITAKSSTQAPILKVTHISLGLNLGRRQKVEIRRCQVKIRDQKKLKQLLSKVKETEWSCFKILKKFILSKKNVTSKKRN